MSEYISKEDALNLIYCRCAIAINCPPFKCGKYRNFAENIAAMMPADVQPIVQGEWRCFDQPYTIINPNCSYECLVCGELTPYRTNFCPNCGAKNLTAIQG